MNTHKTLLWILPLLLAILMSLSQSNAKQAIPTPQILNITSQWKNTNLHHYLQQSLTKLNLLSPSPMVLTGALCFLAASISSAGGVGGGGLFIPILTIVSGVDLKTASSFSAFMVTGGSIANVMCNLFARRKPKFGGGTLIDFDIALVSQPCMLLGVSIGVICNLVFPEWLITVLFAVFLAWSSLKTCKKGFKHWNLESEEADRVGSGSTGLEKGLVKEEVNGNEEPLLIKEANHQVSRFPWMKLGLLITIWFSFCFLYLLRGNHFEQGLIHLEPCGTLYWFLSFIQVPLALAFTAWMLMRNQHQTTNKQLSAEEVAETDERTASHHYIFPLMALLAGVLGGGFGIGGGMLISPLLLHIGIPPEVTAATCSFMVLFSSTMSAFQYLLLGMDHVDTALALSATCFIASLLGLLVVKRAIQGYGRASLIVFSVSTVMILSTILMTSYGAVNVWRDYVSGKNMGFKLPC